MSNQPLVSVILPVYNCEPYVHKAISSVLNQTFSDFELLVIDDCSTDATLQIVQSFSDDRIVIIEKESNTGYTHSLNHGIKIAKGKYIARMDGDDICVPNRFQKQVDFLNSNPDVILYGSAIKIIDSEAISAYPTYHDQLKIQLCFTSAFHHPTVMMRKEILLSNDYNAAYEPAEDYELWTRLAFLGKVANTEEVLLEYRLHQNQTSKLRKAKQQESILKCKLFMLNKLNVSSRFSNQEVDFATNINTTKSFSELQTTLAFYDFVKDSNAQHNVFNPSLFNTTIRNKRKFTIKSFLKNPNYNYIYKVKSVVQLVPLVELMMIINPMKRLKNRFR